MRKAGGGEKEEKGEKEKDAINIINGGDSPSKEKGDKIPTTINNDDKEREKVAMATLMKDMKEQQQPETNDQPEEEEELQHEMAFRQLESVLSEATLIREASKDNAMSDEERRERAGETAMKIMGLLDGMGFDDDSEDGGGSSSEEG